MFGIQLLVMGNVFAQAIALKVSRRLTTTLVCVSAFLSGLNVNLASSGTQIIATVDPLKNGAQFVHY
jgi:hypothetical protein